MHKLLLALIFSTCIAPLAEAKSFGWVQFFSPELEKEIIGNEAADIALELSAPTFSKAKLQEFEKQFSARESQLNAKEKSDYAAVLLLLHGNGAASRAIDFLRAAEQRLPGQYTIAINAATALELGNFYEEAGTWLAEARSRNPQPHLGSEWLQTLIVQAKQQLEADPEWLNENTVLGADFGTAEEPSWPKVADRRSWVQRAKFALLHQIRGRLRFATPPDPLIGDLIFDYANLQLLSGNLKAAEKLYEQAIAFQLPRRQLADRRLLYIRSKLPKGSGSGFRDNLVMGTLVVTSAAVIVALWLKHKKIRKNRALPKT